MFKKLSKDFFLYTIGPQIPRVINFFLLPLYTKYLTTFDYGISGIINSYVGLLAGLGDLGLSIRYSITFFKYPKVWKGRWSVLSGILFWWSVFFAFIQSLFLWALLPVEMGNNKMTVIALNFITTLFFSSWNSLCINLMQFRQKAVVVTGLNVSLGLLTVLFNYIFIIHFRLGYIGWFLQHLLRPRYKVYSHYTGYSLIQKSG